MCICVLLQVVTLFSLQEFWQSWMHITLIIKKRSKENLLGLPQTWTALIRTQSSLVGCQDRGLWGKVSSRFSPFAKTLLSKAKDFNKISEVWSLVYGCVYHRIICPLPSNSNMVLYTGRSDTAVQSRDKLLFFPSMGDFHHSRCHSSRLLFVSDCGTHSALLPGMMLLWSLPVWALSFPAGIYGQKLRFRMKVLLQKRILVI